MTGYQNCKFFSKCFAAFIYHNFFLQLFIATVDSNQINCCSRLLTVVRRFFFCVRT